VAHEFAHPVKAPLEAHAGSFALVVKDFQPGAHRALENPQDLAL
jgi:hypothetical protein